MEVAIAVFARGRKLIQGQEVLQIRHAGKEGSENEISAGLYHEIVS
jgi:hypothetical protein